MGLSLIICIVTGQSFEKETYQVIRVWNPTYSMLEELHSVGIPIDHSYSESGQFIELVARDDQVERIDSRSIVFDIIIDDLGAWTKSQNKPAVQREFPLGSLQGNYTFDEAVARMDTFSLIYPNIVSEKMSIGQTIEGRDIWAFKVSDNPDSNETEPEVLFTGLTHAREPLGMMNLFYYVQHLCENYDVDDEVTFLVNQRELWFVPILNPDGYTWNENYYNQNGSPGYHRKNRRDTGCGTGTSRGVDLNRNYEYDWGADDNGSSPDPCYTTFRGSAPFSEPETSHLRDFVLGQDFQNIMHYHAYGNVLIHSFGSGDYPPEPDYSMITEIGEWMTTENEYSVGTGTELLGYGVNGDAVDWSYGTLGLLSYLPEIGSPSDYFWPSENRVLPLCQDQLYQNKIFSLVAGSDPALVDVEYSTSTTGAGGFISFILSIQNRGLLPSNGEVNIDIEVLNDFVSIINISDTIRYLGSREIQEVQVDCVIPFDAIEGEDSGFQVTVNDSLSLPHNEIVIFRVGSPAALPGDIVTDLAQNIFDVQALAEILLENGDISNFMEYIADLNSDGNITIEDLIELVNIIMEIE
ncbi:MAG: hypothetical protein HQ509_12940 [Candidatus Marinimicrobia bacterium]|nr:hypothetical protein [Candidatus Neomarinimicrobiota bacterium]